MRRGSGSFALLVVLIATLSISGLATAGISPATTKASRQTLPALCAKEILKQPQIGAADVSHAGKVNQVIFVVMNFAEVDPRCNGHYIRSGRFRIEIRNPKYGRRWWSEDGPGWYDLASSGNECGHGGIGSVNSYRKPVMYWTPRSRLRFRLRLQMLEAKSYKVVKTKVTTYPITQIFRGPLPNKVSHEEILQDCP